MIMERDLEETPLAEPDRRISLMEGFPIVSAIIWD